MNTKQNTKNIERWEVHIKHIDHIGPYVGYIRALFMDDKREFCKVKARGYAIETALKTIQMAKDELEDLHVTYEVSL